ncbi:SaV-like [uncultured Caudovirales phage]|uniref:SaV-like n=1 Tax=uncultured Caudovirales phage TaxID=2100421 RepID=A0A6J5KMB9_9CAUD|nr:SaV-like [uncultured Caudovirales phage]
MLQHVEPAMATYVCNEHGPWEYLLDLPPNTLPLCPRCWKISNHVEPVNMVEHPPHYTQGGVECIDAIRAQLSDVEWVGFLRGQVAKYVWRLNKKGDPKENAGKAKFYLNLLMNFLGD